VNETRVSPTGKDLAGVFGSQLKAVAVGKGPDAFFPLMRNACHWLDAWQAGWPIGLPVRFSITTVTRTAEPASMVRDATCRRDVTVGRDVEGLRTVVVDEGGAPFARPEE
jgi:hypothetical protein